MCCEICGKEAKKMIQLLGSFVCDDCFKEIASVSVDSEDYDYYKEVVKALLRNYKYERLIVNPVE